MALGMIPRALKAFTRNTPIAPPIAPPIACSPAQLSVPPQFTRTAGDMKNSPITEPAMAAEKIDVASRPTEATIPLLKIRYRVRKRIASSDMDAAKKPRKWIAVGLRSRLIISARNPTNVADPSFLTDHTVRISIENPITSQKKGKWKI